MAGGTASTCHTAIARATIPSPRLALCGRTGRVVVVLRGADDTADCEWYCYKARLEGTEPRPACQSSAIVKNILVNAARYTKASRSPLVKKPGAKSLGGTGGLPPSRSTHSRWRCCSTRASRCCTEVRRSGASVRHCGRRRASTSACLSAFFRLPQHARTAGPPAASFRLREGL